MATTNPTVYRLSIALIVFVLLTFVLTITTYLFFKQRMDEQLKAQAAEMATSEKQAELLAAQQEIEKYRTVIGEAEGVPAQTVEDNFNRLLTDDFAGFNEEPKSYAKLVGWLRGQLRSKDKDVEASKAEQEQVKKATAEQVEAATAAKTAAEEGRKQAETTTQKVKEDFEGRWKEHESEQKKLLDQKQTAEQTANRLELLIARIADGGQYLSPGRQKDFKSRDAAEDQLGVIYAELRDRAKAIDEQNRILTGLRVADPALQQQVLASTPKDDRIDGFDGRVMSVDEASRSVLISVASTRGVRPGMVFHVFGPEPERPQVGDRKGTVEVTDVEGPSLVRAAIRRDSNRSPILPGDGVATSLWAAGAAPEIVIVGYVNLDDAGRADNERLAQLAQRAGARVVDAVSPLTAMVVDGGKPPADSGDEETAAEISRRQKRSIDAAKSMGIKVVGVSALLDTLGLSREAITADRLVRPTGSR